MTTIVHCPATRKHAYPDWATGVRYALRSSKRSGRPIRVYGCPECGGFHLTKIQVWVDRKAAA